MKKIFILLGRLSKKSFIVLSFSILSSVFCNGQTFMHGIGATVSVMAGRVHNPGNHMMLQLLLPILPGFQGTISVNQIVQR